MCLKMKIEKKITAFCTYMVFIKIFVNVCVN